MLIDHVIYGHPDLSAGVDTLRRYLGVEAAGGGTHPGRGTHNKLLALGTRTYLEIVAPDPDQPVPSTPRPYGVEGITEGGLVGWAIAVDDVEAARAQARSQGFDPGQVVEGQREDATGRLLRWRATGNAQVAGLVPFLIDWGDTPHPAADAPAGLRLGSVWVEHPRPAQIVPVLAAMGADVEVRPAPRPALVARIETPRGERELR